MDLYGRTAYEGVHDVVHIICVREGTHSFGALLEVCSNATVHVHVFRCMMYVCLLSFREHADMSSKPSKLQYRHPQRVEVRRVAMVEV